MLGIVVSRASDIFTFGVGLSPPRDCSAPEAY
jgi:hypothetical protein